LGDARAEEWEHGQALDAEDVCSGFADGVDCEGDESEREKGEAPEMIE
jgi:hypothetical protein